MKSKFRFFEGYDVVPKLYEEDPNDEKLLRFKLPDEGYQKYCHHDNDSFCFPNLYDGKELIYSYAVNTNYRDNTYNCNIISFDATGTRYPYSLTEDDIYPNSVLNFHYDDWGQFHKDLLLSRNGDDECYEFFRGLDRDCGNQIKIFELIDYQNVIPMEALYLPALVDTVTDVCTDDNKKYDYHECKKETDKIVERFIDDLNDLRSDILKNNF